MKNLPISMSINYELGTNCAAFCTLRNGSFHIELNGSIPAIEAAYKGAKEQQNLPFLYAILASELAGFLAKFRSGATAATIRKLIPRFRFAESEMGRREHIFAHLLHQMLVADFIPSSDPVPMSAASEAKKPEDLEAKNQMVAAMLLRPGGVTYAEVETALKNAGFREQTYLKYYARRNNIRLEITTEKGGKKRYQGFLNNEQSQHTPLDPVITETENLSAEDLLEREAADLFGNEDEQDAA